MNPDIRRVSHRPALHSRRRPRRGLSPVGGLFLLTVFALATLPGCGGSTRPKPVTKLPAIDLLASPVADTSRLYQCYLDTNLHPAEFLAAIPSADIDALGPIDDIWIRFWGPPRCLGMEFDVLHTTDSIWRVIESRDEGGACIDIPTVSTWLLSVIDADPGRHFIGDGHVIRLRGDRIDGPAIRLIQYRSDYAPVVVNAADTYGADAIGFDGELLWAVTSSETGDSLIAFNPAGERVRTMVLTGIHTAGIAWTGTEFFVIIAANPPRVATLTLDGVFKEVFTIPVGYWDNIRGGVAWQDSLLWLPRWGWPEGTSDMGLIAIDPVASMASGEAHIVQSLPAPDEFRNMDAMTAAGESILVIARAQYALTQRLYRVSAAGEVDDLGELRVAAGPMTWDGESVWLLHYGASPFSTGGILMSRFTVPGGTP